MFGSATAFPGAKEIHHMKAVHRTTICTVFSLMMLGAAFAQHIQTDFDHQANFSQYKTYSWQQIKAADSLWDSRIKNAVDAQLAAKGWTQVDSGGDVAIVAIKTTQTRRSLQTFYDGFGGAFGTPWWYRVCGGGVFLESGKLCGGDSIEAHCDRSVPRKNRDDPAHRPAAAVGNTDPLFSTGSHTERSFLRSVAP